MPYFLFALPRAHGLCPPLFTLIRPVISSDGFTLYHLLSKVEQGSRLHTLSRQRRWIQLFRRPLILHFLDSFPRHKSISLIFKTASRQFEASTPYTP